MNPIMQFDEENKERTSSLVEKEIKWDWGPDEYPINLAVTSKQFRSIKI